jgi:hypothetical protein
VGRDVDAVGVRRLDEDRASHNKYSPKKAFNSRTLYRKSQKISMSSPRLASPIKLGLALCRAPASAPSESPAPRPARAIRGPRERYPGPIRDGSGTDITELCTNLLLRFVLYGFKTPDAPG